MAILHDVRFTVLKNEKYEENKNRNGFSRLFLWTVSTSDQTAGWYQLTTLARSLFDWIENVALYLDDLSVARLARKSYTIFTITCKATSIQFLLSSAKKFLYSTSPVLSLNTAKTCFSVILAVMLVSQGIFGLSIPAVSLTCTIFGMEIANCALKLLDLQKLETLNRGIREGGNVQEEKSLKKLPSQLLSKEVPGQPDRQQLASVIERAYWTQVFQMTQAVMSLAKEILLRLFPAFLLLNSTLQLGSSLLSNGISYWEEMCSPWTVVVL